MAGWGECRYTRLTADALCDAAVHPPEVAAWMRKMVDYNIPGGKNTRGLSVLQVRFDEAGVGWG
jgi:hypothetical protein